MWLPKDSITSPIMADVAHSKEQNVSYKIGLTSAKKSKQNWICLLTILPYAPLISL